MDKASSAIQYHIAAAGQIRKHQNHPVTEGDTKGTAMVKFLPLWVGFRAIGKGLHVWNEVVLYSA